MMKKITLTVLSLGLALLAGAALAQDEAEDDESRYDRRDRFETVCGVIVDGETSRYKCRAVDFYIGKEKVKTALHYPDQLIRLEWQDGENVTLHFAGMNAMPATYSTSEGETDFYFENKTYFYISDKKAAEQEVKNFKE